MSLIAVLREIIKRLDARVAATPPPRCPTCARLGYLKAVDCNHPDRTVVCDLCYDEGVVETDAGGGDTGSAYCTCAAGATRAFDDRDAPTNACEAGTCGHEDC